MVSILQYVDNMILGEKDSNKTTTRKSANNNSVNDCDFCYYGLQ